MTLRLVLQDGLFLGLRVGSFLAGWNFTLRFQITEPGLLALSPVDHPGMMDDVHVEGISIWYVPNKTSEIVWGRR